MKKSRIIIFFFFVFLLMGGLSFRKERETFIQESDISIYIDGVLAEAIPSKTDNVIFDEQTSTCNHGATIRWDYEDWGPVVINGTTTKTKCNLRFKTGYKESLLNGTDPILKDELIPVTIENDGTVKRADLSEEWYKYENQRWANAIILKDESTQNNYNVKDVIPEEAIESYFVWIPRYRYKIFNEGNYEGLTATVVDNKVESKAKIIEVIFENHTTPISNGSKVNEWLTHPAFTSFDSNGMWVGKFETSKSNDKEDNSINPSGVEIKPNVTSWRSIQISNAFYTSYNYKRNLNSHLMKNTEWGAAAYLQHSVYGSRQSVRFNNNGDYVTGYSATNEPTCGYTGTNLDCNKYGIEVSVTQAYNTTIGVLASTTGNITGVYDMSGGVYEHVMGVMVDKSGKPMSGRSAVYNGGFNGSFGCPTCDGDSTASLTTGIPFPSDTRYYDTYAYAENVKTYSRRILGDATGEMGPFATVTYESERVQIGSWYADEAWFVSNAAPWFMRGSSFPGGDGAGVFAFHYAYGNVGSVSFRVVLSV